MKILGFYERNGITLVEKEGNYFVIDKQNKVILYQGDEETCTKLFIMMAADFIEKGDFV